MRDRLLYSFKNNSDLDTEILSEIVRLTNLDHLLNSSEPEMIVWLFHKYKKHRFPGGKEYVIENYNAKFEPSDSMEELISNSLLLMLHKIERREITITPSCDPNIHVGEIDYTCSNGWILKVYSRVFEWRGIYGYTSPQGIYFDPFMLRNDKKLIDDYTISTEVEREVYQFKFENRMM